MISIDIKQREQQRLASSVETMYVQDGQLNLDVNKTRRLFFSKQEHKTNTYPRNPICCNSCIINVLYSSDTTGTKFDPISSAPGDHRKTAPTFNISHGKEDKGTAKATMQF